MSFAGSRLSLGITDKRRAICSWKHTHTHTMVAPNASSGKDIQSSYSVHELISLHALGTKLDASIILSIHLVHVLRRSAIAFNLDKSVDASYACSD